MTSNIDDEISGGFLARYDDIIRGLYAAARGLGTFTQPCAMLAETLNLWTFQILGVDPRTGALQFSWDGGTVPQQAWLEYFTTYHHINPRIPAAIKLPLNGWLHDHADFAPEVFEREPFFRDFMIPHGGRYSSSCKIIDNHDLIVFLSAHPHNTRPPLNRAEVKALERIRVHICDAIDLYRSTQRSSSDAFIARAMLDAIDQPVVLIDGIQTVHHMNRRAKDMIGRSRSLSVANGQLQCINPKDTDRLAYALRQLGLASDADLPTRMNRAIVRIGPKCASPEFVIVVVVVRPETSSGAFGLLPRAILLLHPLNGTTLVDSIVLSHAYDMTPAQASIAAAIANGSTPAEIATARRVSMATIRSQLSEIYAKVGVSRQADLVQTLSQMPKESFGAVGTRLVL